MVRSLRMEIGVIRFRNNIIRLAALFSFLTVCNFHPLPDYETSGSLLLKFLLLRIVLDG